jgi:hypothetical protein
MKTSGSGQFHCFQCGCLIPGTADYCDSCILARKNPKTIKQHFTNVFEAGIGEDAVPASRRGERLFRDSRVLKLIQKKRDQLASVHISGHYFEAERKSGDITVEARFELEPKFKIVDKDMKPIDRVCGVTVVRKGEFSTWVLDCRRASVIIDLADDHEIIEMADTLHYVADQIAQTGPSIFNSKTFVGKDEDGKPDIHNQIINRLVQLLKQDVDDANRRLGKRINSIARTEEFKEAALKCYYDEIREKVHGALKKFVDIDPEIIHRFVDELYAKQVHDS